MTNEASEEFWNALIHSGSNVVDCDLCGRVHFVDDRSFDYEEGELERLYSENEKEPDKVIFHSGESSISWGYINGRQVVYGCPCNLAVNYEKIFWDSRYVVAKYFENIAKKLQKNADDVKNLAERIKTSC